MDWQPIASGAWEAQGYRIAAFRINEGWIYGLFAPPLADKEFDKQLKTHYARGEFVPQRRALLGHYSRPEVAREAAEEHKLIGKVHYPFPKTTPGIIPEK